MTKFKVQERLMKGVQAKMSFEYFLEGMESVMSADEFNKLVTKVCYKLGKDVLGKKLTKKILEG